MPVRKAISFLATLVLLLTSPAWSQRQLYRSYGSNAGLTNLSVRALFQDHTGFLWVGTEDGLFRYDGTEFRAYGRSEGLKNNEVRAIAESPDGKLWVGTQGGLAVKTGQRFISVEDGGRGSVDAVAFDGSGRLYAEHTNGIYRAIPDNQKIYRFSSYFLGSSRGLSVRSDAVLFTDGTHVWRGELGKPPAPLNVKDLPGDSWNGLATDREGNIWLKGQAHLYELLHSSVIGVDRTKEARPTLTDRLYAGPSGTVYLSSADGVTAFTPERKFLFDEKHGLPTAAVGAVMEDRAGSLWIGTIGGGLLQRLGRGEWESWNKLDGLHREMVWAVHHTPSGKTWVGTNGGLSILDANGHISKTLGRKQGLTGDVVLSITEDSAGNIIAGTEPLGVSVADSSGHLRATYTASSGLRGERISSVAVDRQELVWAVGPAGVFCSRSLQDKHRLHFEQIAVPRSEEPVVYRQVRIAGNGDVLITSSNGLLWLHNAHWSTFTVSDGLRANDLSAVADWNGTVWVSYRDSLGVSRLERKGATLSVRHLTAPETLASDQAVALAADDEGRLWVGTDRGVDLVQQNHHQHFGETDGLIWDDTDGGALEAEPSGSLWVGTSKGLSRRSSHPANDSTVEAPVTITSIKGGKQQWEPTEMPTLPHAGNSLDLRFSRLNFDGNASTRFRYRLLGLGTEWTEISQGSLHLARLPPGNYAFEVESGDADASVRASPAVFKFTITPSWWQTTWFRLALVLSVTSAAVTLWKVRVFLLRRKELWLQAEIAERTAELRESERRLQSIAYTDTLTSLPNRRKFNQDLEETLNSQDNFALALIDLDRFKQINDGYGHDAGDAVLMEAAHRFNSLLCNGEVAYRLGGDEFALLLCSTNECHRAEQVCLKVIQSFSVPILFMRAELTVGCSIGVALVQEKRCSSATLYKSADTALYEAKRAGKSTFKLCSIPPLAALVAT